ncbi:MAG: methylenetetrahydrofolate reductase C-terminal domain-containing protein [Deltaproteobacteria bacterium]|nr:methylenetetrahydrofolate reductase C-terminal domain-containing protein [Deltaproteobacteria bacterium]MBW1927988.1 methylenetetrahydrofolate reductase C-terminal domain-containing protein [Deltaproteobacteria bacterium]MBW2024149.1 methylenetetrahydrofolate reductase C-terminal domain-containing protein [Deltaproteobacteria bacterium]MBW2124431.1 methylenetetrahydrofolate reductase C-terminal domain-containing protein [Deltaproteobacteria bacterium]
MIVAKRKPFPEIMESLEGYDKVLILGCGTCVAVCLAGGEKEVGLLSSQLAIAYELKEKSLEIGEATVERQCDREFLQEIRHQIKEYPVILSLACGVGVQFLAEAYPDKIVLPGVDTAFIGSNDDVGLWTERCRMCNQCYLALTGGVCPVTMCPKGLLNGPCSGMRNGRCEVGPDRTCAWVLIYERMKETGRLERVQTVLPPRDYSRSTTPAVLTHKAYRRRYSANE